MTDRFASRFDEILATRGPPALFTLDPDGQLRLALNLTREAWERSDMVVGFDPVHALFRDQQTGWVQYVYATVAEFAHDVPRADSQRYDTEADALAALERVGSPRIYRGAWPP